MDAELVQRVTKLEKWRDMQGSRPHYIHWACLRAIRGQVAVESGFERFESFGKLMSLLDRDQTQVMPRITKFS